MKSFKEMRNKMPAGEHVWGKTIDGVKVMVHKDGSKFVAYIDGDKLDSYKTQEEAKKTITQFLKQFKGK